VREMSLLERLAQLPPSKREALLDRLPAGRRMAILRDWRVRGRPAQLPPDGDWAIWLILAGRGFGKTRTGAEWVTRVARGHAGARIALVGTTASDVLGVMAGGESGLLSVAPPDFRPRLVASRRELIWPNGARALMVSAVEPDRLRGPQFHFAWCDEIAAWSRPQPVWDNLRMGLRLGVRPRVIVTTTPRPIPFLDRLMKADGVFVTRGATRENRTNLPTAFLADMEASYAGTTLGRQELEGEIVARREGALWHPELIDRGRCPQVPELVRVVVGVDPPAGPGTCGIVVAGLDAEGIALVLADASVSDVAPEAWAAAVTAAASRFGADRVVAEVNQGGAMVASVLRAVQSTLPLKTVRAARGKAARAEPVAALYAQGRVRHAGGFPLLEDEMCGLMAGGGYVGPGLSPDRADALVWAVTELMLGTREADPSFRVL
jgi:phage terminase large subunit-like protein